MSYLTVNNPPIGPFPSPYSPRSSGVARYPQIEQLLVEARSALVVRGYAPKTIKAYCGWARRFLHFHRGVHPSRLDRGHVDQWLSHLAEVRMLSAKSRNQAASALGFLFAEVFGRAVMDDVPRARGPVRVPAVLSHQEVMRIIDHLRTPYSVIASVLYGSGLRLSECLRLRVKDLDFEHGQITVRDGKGGKDRFAVLPERARRDLRAQIQCVEQLRQRDRASLGAGWAPLPGAMHRKDPTAGYTLAWQFVFPATRIRVDRTTGRRGRRSLHPSAVQRAMKRAVAEASIPKRATCHTLRHSFATELLRAGCDIRKLKDLLGHTDIRVTMTYLHAVENTGLGIRSPLDRDD